MILADYHVHSYPLSPDASDSMAAMARAALDSGVTHLCFTNHIEDCAMTSDDLGSFDMWDEQIDEFGKLREEFRDEPMDLRLGAELSSPHYVPERGREIYARPEFDFIIGSIHNLRNRPDFYIYKRHVPGNIVPEVEEYLDECANLARFGCCDIIGHIGYMLRYMSYQGQTFDIMDYRDRLTALLRACVEHGVGIEVNTSGMKSPLHDFVPNAAVVKLYRELGGEIITVGSDAHRVDNVGGNIRTAYDMLISCGFKYVCLFRKHEPEFVNIS